MILSLRREPVVLSEFQDDLNLKEKTPLSSRGRGEDESNPLCFSFCFQDTDVLYIVSHFFLDEWRKFVR